MDNGFSDYSKTSGQTHYSKAYSRINKVKVLNSIRNADNITRAEIVRETGISPATITRIVDELIFNQKLVKQIGNGEFKRGRPPKIVQFNGDNSYVIGLDWGRTRINAALADLNAKVIKEINTPSIAHQDFNKDLKNVLSIIDYLINQSEIEPGKILGIGIGAAGFIDKEGVVEYSPKFNWKNVNVIKPINNRFNIPVIINNSVHAMAIGELYYGNHGLNDFIFVSIDYGIGSGIISNGKHLKGYDGISGEFGHTQVIPTSIIKRKCVCGNYNCLECFSAGWGIEYNSRLQIKDHPDSLVNLLASHDKNLIDINILTEAAKKGDKFAIDIFLEAADILGASISNFTNILNPQAVIWGDP